MIIYEFPIKHVNLLKNGVWMPFVKFEDAKKFPHIIDTSFYPPIDYSQTILLEPDTDGGVFMTYYDLSLMRKVSTKIRQQDLDDKVKKFLKRIVEVDFIKNCCEDIDGCFYYLNNDIEIEEFNFTEELSWKYSGESLVLYYTNNWNNTEKILTEIPIYILDQKILKWDTRINIRNAVHCYVLMKKHLKQEVRS